MINIVPFSATRFIFRKDGGTLRTMNADKLIKTLPHLQQQIDSLLEFDCTSQVL